MIKPIKQIAHDEFHAKCRHFGAVGIHVEREWWGSDDGLLVGAIIRDKIDNDWSAVLTGPDQHGDYCAFNLVHSLSDIGAARDWLHRTMIEVINSGQTVFPQ